MVRSAHIWLLSKEVESLTDISEYQEVIDLSGTKYEEKSIVQCMIVEETSWC